MFYSKNNLNTFASSKQGQFLKNQSIVSTVGICNSIDLSLENCPTGVSKICKYPFSTCKLGQLSSNLATSISASWT